MSIASQHPVAVRRLEATALAALAAVAAVVTVVLVVAWVWVGAAASAGVLLAATTGFWRVLDGGRSGSVPLG